MSTTPATRVEFWLEKFERNKKRDAKNIKLLRRANWRVLVVWQCEIEHDRRLRSKLKRFLLKKC